MILIRHPRFRRAVALCLLASLSAGLACPVLAGRTQGVTSIYSQWLGDRLGDRADDRTDRVMDRLASTRFPTLRTYVVAFVNDLVDEQGLYEAARMLDEESPSSAGDLTRSFLEGLRSLSAEKLPEATLLPESDGRAVPLGRSTATLPGQVDAPRVFVVRASTPGTVVRGTASTGRPASGGAQPLGP